MKVNNKTSLKKYDTDTKDNEIQSKNGSVLTKVSSAINESKERKKFYYTVVTTV